MQDNVCQFEFRISEINQRFKITARLSEGYRNTRTCRVLAARVVDGCAKLLSGCAAPLTRFRSRNLEDDRIELIVVALCPAAKHRKNMFCVRHRSSVGS